MNSNCGNHGGRNDFPFPSASSHSTSPRMETFSDAASNDSRANLETRRSHLHLLEAAFLSPVHQNRRRGSLSRREDLLSILDAAMEIVGLNGDEAAAAAAATAPVTPRRSPSTDDSSIPKQ